MSAAASAREPSVAESEEGVSTSEEGVAGSLAFEIDTESVYEGAVPDADNAFTAAVTIAAADSANAAVARARAAALDAACAAVSAASAASRAALAAAAATAAAASAADGPSCIYIHIYNIVIPFSSHATRYPACTALDTAVVF